MHSYLEAVGEVNVHNTTRYAVDHDVAAHDTDTATNKKPKHVGEKKGSRGGRGDKIQM